MSSVRSPAIDSLSFCHNFFSKRNTNTRSIQIEEKSLRMNAFIVHQKERYLRPGVIIVSITMLKKKNGFFEFLNWRLQYRFDCCYQTQ